MVTYLEGNENYTVAKEYYSESPYASIIKTTDNRFVVVNNVTGLAIAMIDNWNEAKVMRQEVSDRYQRINHSGK